MLVAIPVSKDDAVAGLTITALVMMIVSIIACIKRHSEIKKLSGKKSKKGKEVLEEGEKLGKEASEKSEESNAKTEKEIKKLKKRQSTSFAILLLGSSALMVCTGGNRGKLKRIISSSFTSEKVSEEYDEQSMETQVTEVMQSIDQPSGQTESVQEKQEATRYYDVECEIRLESVRELSESIDVQEREQQVFFGLLSDEWGSGEQVYNLVKRELLGRVWMDNQNMLKRLSSEEQEEVLKITSYNDRFWENVEYVKKNPPYYPGRSEWYIALPAVSEIFSVIQRQELQAKKSPDIELENQLFNNYWRLAREYKKQGWTEKKDIIFLQEQAAYHLLEKMEFEDISIDNVYKTIVNLQEVYRAMEDENVSGADTEVGKLAEILQESIERFIQYEIFIKDISNDPIVMAGRK